MVTAPLPHRTGNAGSRLYAQFQGLVAAAKKMLITEQQCEKALVFLRDTAAKYGQLRGYLAFAQSNLRRVKSLQMLEIKEGSVAEKEAKAYASEDYLKAIQDEQNATAEYETLRARREAAVFCIEVWRSINSARKQGINV